MSDSFMRIVPVDPRFVPSKPAQKAAEDLLRAAAPDADLVSSVTSAGVEFHGGICDPIRILCPACEEPVDTEVWASWMDGDYSPQTGFRLGPVATPCCGHRTPLNELKYEFPHGFSRYVLSARNPGLPLAMTELTQISGALGGEVRVVWERL